jgi:hypothetical protein
MGADRQDRKDSASPLREDDPFNSNSQGQRHGAKDQAIQEDFELAADLFEQHDVTHGGITDQGETAEDIYRQLRANGWSYPGRYMQGVHEKAGGIGNPVLEKVSGMIAW